MLNIATPADTLFLDGLSISKLPSSLQEQPSVYPLKTWLDTKTSLEPFEFPQRLTNSIAR